MLLNSEPLQNSSPLQRRKLGLELRRLRKAAGLTLGEVASELYRSSSTVSRMERARVSITPRDVRDMLQLYGVESHQQVALLELALEAHRKDPFWQAHGDLPPDFRTYVSLEKVAGIVMQHECLAIPGLLQLRPYALAFSRALFPNATAEQIERHVEFRMARQTLLLEDDPPLFEAVLDEAALRRLVGGRRVMRDQPYHLADVTEIPNIILQVIPFDAGEHGGMAGPFTILTFRDSSDLDETYIEYSAAEIMINTPTQLQRHRSVFERLQSTALSPRDSAAFFRDRAMKLQDPSLEYP